MNLLTAENITKSYGEKILTDSITLNIDANDKIGLIGINGTGKSTFLKIIAGVEHPDQGKIACSNGLKIEYLSQNPDFFENATILEQIFRGNSPLMKLIREYETKLYALNQASASPLLEREIVALSQQMDALDAWRLESDAKTILTKLGIHDFNAKMGTLSGGQRKRVALASALITPSDLLILDEPTNHLDSESIQWLEDYLNKHKVALLMVTHDRYFLDRIATRIIELDRGKLYSYTGNYSVFVEKKLEREELEKASERKRQNLLRNELEWIQRGAKARSTKQKARIDRFEELQAANPEFISDKVEITASASRLGKKVIELHNISKAYGDRMLIQDFSYTLLRNDRIGIIGSNGSGKSTLLKIIAGQVSPDLGNVETGQTVKVAFFSQEHTDMDQSLRVIDYIREEAEYLDTPEGRLSASQLLERFLFPPAVQWTPISKLSGGEKRRLYLLKCLMCAPNVILLDEPTNDLDIQTLTLLESYLDDFPGAVITVSHDRYFLDRIAEKIFAFEKSGQIHETPGNYSDYQRYTEFLTPKEEEPTSIAPKKAELPPPRKTRPLKLSFKEQREYEEIDGIIEGLENELKAISIKISEGSSDYALLQELSAKQELLEQQLETAIERWAYLNELQSQIVQNSHK